MQHVDKISQALGEQRGTRVLTGYLIKNRNFELKSISDPADRDKALADSIAILGKDDISGKKSYCSMIYIDQEQH